MRDWKRFLPDEELAIYQNAGYAKAGEWGEHPALLVVDCTYAFIGSRPDQTLQEAMLDYPTACGPAGWQALPHIASLLEACRLASIPVVFTQEDLEAQTIAGIRATKGGSNRPPQTMEQKERGNRIPDAIGPLQTEWVLKKGRASAFHGTMLSTFLTLNRVDTLIIVGTTTSGCIAATAIDAFAEGYRVFVVEEGCFDRTPTSHIAHLWDLNAKYATVMATEEILAAIAAKENV
jgi:maleamate amidohydrolase